MKILFCASRASHIMNFHLPYLEYYKKNGWQVDVLTQGEISPSLCDRCYNIPFQKNLVSPSNFSTILRISKILKQEKYDIISTHTTLTGFMVRAAALLGSKHKSRLVHISHGYLFGNEHSFKSSLYVTCEKIASHATDCLLVMNQDDLALAEKHKFCKTVHYINGMGIQPARFPNVSSAEIEAFQADLKLSPSDFVFACVGEFSERKNQKLILEALASLGSRAEHIRVLFAGTGTREEFCKDEVQRLELSRQVRFLGQVQNTTLLYHSCDAVLSASRSEGLPFNIMEALLCHVPAVASRVKGHTDLLNETNSLLFESNDSVSLAEAIYRLSSDTDLYNRLKSNTSLEEKYFIEQTLPMIVGYYGQTSPAIPIHTELKGMN